MAKKKRHPMAGIPSCPCCGAHRWQEPPVVWFYGVVRCGTCRYEAPRDDLACPVGEAR